MIEKVSMLKKIYRNTRWEAAKLWMKMHNDVEVIGIAGSVGKTTTKEVVASVLGEKFGVVKSEKNFDPIFNLPLTALKIRNNEKFVAELGIDMPGQMEHYFDLVKPKIGIITRLSVEHTDSEHFGSLEKAIEEELKLLDNLPENGLALLNGDDQTIYLNKGKYKGKSITYGFDAHNDQIIHSYTYFLDESLGVNAEFCVYADNKLSTFKFKMLGKHNALAATTGILVGRYYGLSDNEIQTGLLKLMPPEGRMEVKKTTWGILIDDAYNASPEAVKAAIDVTSGLDQDGVLVLGDMLELGELSKIAHQEVGEYAAEMKIKYLVGYGDCKKEVIDGFVNKGGEMGNCLIANSHQEIVSWLNEMKLKTVLVKGSKGMKMGEVIKELVV